ncbi:MAG: hypothetical protein K6F35_06350 [Lachnospiraceae bacterium]|nr:hypothetical protein [Lachnospiraceae bacterium]
MKKNLKLYRRRLAMVLAVILTIGNLVPVNAGSLAAGQAEAQSEAQAEAQSEAQAEAQSEAQAEAQAATQAEAQEAAGAGAQAAEQTEAQAGAQEIPEADVWDAVGEAAGKESFQILPDTKNTKNAKDTEDTGRGGPVSSDATIMYYMVGSNLEGNGAEATRDIIEIMSGIEQAEGAADSVSNAKIHVVIETGGVSDKAMEKDGAHDKALKELEGILKDKETASANDLKLLQTINSVNDGRGIQWNQNERWVLSDHSIKPADNPVAEENTKRVMTGIKDAGKAPELIDFITTTAQKYPAKRYMLVLWDHGGGPKGGFGGDDRGGQNNTYITSDQLTESLSEARINLRGQESNANFDKFEFIGFDACLMGNLETAMALQPYARYLFGSEDLEPGTGWDHRGYVKEIFYPGFAREGGWSGSQAYEPDMMDITVPRIGFQMVTDNTAFYNHKEIRSTMAVVNLDAVSLNSLNEKLDELSKALMAQLIGSGDQFVRDSYVNFMSAAEETVNFNGSSEGIADLYSFCRKLQEKFSSETVKEKADAAAMLLKPKGHDDERSNEGLVTLQQYTQKYPFARKEGEDYKALGGLTIFLPCKGSRFTYNEDGAEKTYDALTEYLGIYKRVKYSPGITDGYTSLLKTFCAAQAIGGVLSAQYDKTPSEISQAMKELAKSLEKEYDPLNDAAKNMMASMAGEEGEIIRGRISSNDMHMKTVFSEDRCLDYALDLDREKVSLVKNIRQQAVLNRKDGGKNNLGYLPAAKAPQQLYLDDHPIDKDRYVVENRKAQKWFAVNGIPAPVFSIRNLDDESDQDFFDPFGETHIQVQFPAMMMKKGSPYYDEVVLEAEFQSGSMNGVKPDGFYGVDTNTKQLTGFVPWKEVADDTEFEFVSDMGEFFENMANGFDPENVYKTGYTMWIPKLRTETGEPLEFSRDEELSEAVKGLGKDVESGSLFYAVWDVFGGSYGLDDLGEGEPVTASITLSGDHMTEKEKKEGITLISQNRGDIYPVITFQTDSGEYNLHFPEGKEPGIGYLDAEGQFNRLKTKEDFQKLGPGHYKLVFEGYDPDKDRIIIDGATPLSIDGVDGSVPASQYAFWPNVQNPGLTVINKEAGLTVESVGQKGELPFGFFKTLKPYEDLKHFVAVFNGDGNVTESVYTSFSISANGNNYDMNKEADIAAFRALDLKLGDVVSVNALFYLEKEDENIYAPKPAELTIGKQPVKLIGTNPFDTYEFDCDVLFWENDDYYIGGESYTPSVNVAMHLDGEIYADRAFGPFVGNKDLTVDQLISENHVPAIYIDRDGAEKVGSYPNLYFGPDDGSGKKRAASWEDKHFNEEFNKLLVVEKDEDVLLEKYNVHPAALVSFRTLKDDTELYGERIVFYDENGTVKEDKRRCISGDSALKISGNTVKQWYIGIGKQKRVPVYLDGTPELYDEMEGEKSVGKQLVLSANGGWIFYLPEAASSNKVCFYAGYEEAVSTVEQKGKKTFSISIGRVDPVEYTGKALVTTTSGKNGSRSIELTVTASGNKVLEEGKDYTVSYRNNKNAAGPSAGKKAPALIITGKGKAYKGLKAEVKFTILPADLRTAEIAASRQFAPFTKAGKISVATTMKLPSGVKVPASLYEVRYYDDGVELTKERIKELYKGTEMRSVEIRVYAKEPKNKNAAKNYRIGSMPDRIYVTGYPKGGKALTAKLKQKKEAFVQDKAYDADELARGLLKAESLKAGREKVEVKDLLPVRAYTDKNLVYTSPDDGKTINRAGTYYLAFALKEEAGKKYKVYKPAVVKYVLSGKKLVKGKTRIDAASGTLSFNGSGENVPVPVWIDTEKLKAPELLLTYTERDGTTCESTVGYAAAQEKTKKEYDYLIDEKGKLLLTGLDNGAKGSYTLTFQGTNDYVGSFKLTYKVK